MVCIDQKYIKQTDVILHFRIYNTEQQIWHKRIWYNGARNTMFQRIQKYKRTKGHKTKKKKNTTKSCTSLLVPRSRKKIGGTRKIGEKLA